MSILPPRELVEAGQTAAKEAKEKVWELAIQVRLIGVPDEMAG